MVHWKKCSLQPANMLLIVSFLWKTRKNYPRIIQSWEHFYRNKFYFCGFCSWVICQSLHIDKIHEDNNSFLIIPCLLSKCYKCCQKMFIFWDNRRKIDMTAFCFGLYWTVNLSFLQPIKLHEICIKMRSWNRMNMFSLSSVNLLQISSRQICGRHMSIVQFWRCSRWPVWCLWQAYKCNRVVTSQVQIV